MSDSLTTCRCAWPDRARRAEALSDRYREALERADAILMEHQQGESGLPSKPAGAVVRPALEVIAAALSEGSSE